MKENSTLERPDSLSSASLSRSLRLSEMSLKDSLTHLTTRLSSSKMLRLNLLELRMSTKNLLKRKTNSEANSTQLETSCLTLSRKFIRLTAPVWSS